MKAEALQAKLDAAVARGWRLYVRRPGEAAREVTPTVAALFEAMGPEPPGPDDSTPIEVLWRRQPKEEDA